MLSHFRQSTFLTIRIKTLLPTFCGQFSYETKNGHA